MKNYTERNKILEFEIWCSIGDEEKIRLNKINNNINNNNSLNNNNNNCLYLCDKSYKILLPIIFDSIITNNYDNDEWTITKACDALINIFSLCCNINFINDINIYKGENFKSNDEHKIHSAIFTCILENKYHNELEIIIRNSIETISNFLFDINQPNHLKEISSWTIERICENYAYGICNDNDLFNKFIALILNLLESIKIIMLIIILIKIIIIIISIYKQKQQSNNSINFKFTLHNKKSKQYK